MGNIFERWPIRNYFILGGIIAIVVYSFSLIFYLYYCEGVLYFYIAVFLLIVAYIYIQFEYVHKNDVFHFHHYMCAQLLIFFTCF